MLPISDDVRKKIKSDGQWQTKDFECILSMAEIKDDGTLWFRYARNVWDENVKTGVYDITGAMGGLVEVDVKWVQLEDYFGYIYFYTTIEKEWYVILWLFFYSNGSFESGYHIFYFSHFV